MKRVEIKQLHHPYCPDDIHDDDIVLILGFFDGVHMGHQCVIEQGVQLAHQQGLKAVVMTFTRHPSLVYEAYDPIKHAYLTVEGRKADLMRKLGVDILYEMVFTSSLGALSPQAFVDQYMINWNARYVVAGFDYTYGKSTVANMARLPEYANEQFEVVVVQEKTQNQQKISSTRIRALIASGQVMEANQLLGYYYETSGYVVHGAARGRTLGYPTANIASHPDVFIPKTGIYTVLIEVGGTWYGGMASIGYNVTFGYQKDYSLEVHIFQFDQMIYGEDVNVKWLTYLRQEEKFETIDQLIEQLDKDKEASLAFLRTCDKTLMI